MIPPRFAQWAASLILLHGALLAAAQPASFTLTAGAETFDLEKARGKYVALHFLLRTECPYCQKYVVEYTSQAPTVAGVAHVFLKPDSEDEVRGWNAKLRDAGIDATIFRDADAKLAQAFKIPDGYAFHDQTMHYPSLVLLGPDGREAYRYVGKDNTDRLPFRRFADKVAALSRQPDIGQYLLGDDGLALKGHDPVAYFTAGAPKLGAADRISRYRGVTYRFASEENRAAFAASPEKYAPAYGGWCATAMAEGRKVEIDPGNFKITGGRLFLFYKGWLGDAKRDWERDEPGLTQKADGAWRQIAPRDAALGTEK